MIILKFFSIRGNYPGPKDDLYSFLNLTNHKKNFEKFFQGKIVPIIMTFLKKKGGYNEEPNSRDFHISLSINDIPTILGVTRYIFED